MIATVLAVLALAVPAKAASLNAATVFDEMETISRQALGNAVPPGAIRQVPVDPAASPVPAAPASPSSVQQQPGGNAALPDLSFTPGRLCTPQDPDFAEYRYPEHIAYCKRNVTLQMKQQIAAHYGIPESEWPNYEFDHLISLELGGDSYVDNIWPQPIDQAKVKDQLENELGAKLKAGTITQAEAVRQIYAWFGISTPNPTTAPHAP